MQCPSCKADIPEKTRLCPSCGSLVYAGQAQQRDADGTTHYVVSPSPFVTKSKWGDIALGVVVSWTGAYASIIGIPIAFFLLRKKYPVLATTIGIMWVLGIIGFVASIVLKF
jgi:hypothetical protein